MQEWHNPCGGLRWRILSSGLIELEGKGIEYANSDDDLNMRRSWKHWGPLIQEAAARYSVPATWVLAVMTVETGLWSSDPHKQSTIVSPAGAIGLMQVIPLTARGLGFSADQMYEPVANIAAGTKLMSQLMGQGLDLPALTAKYNSGRLCSPGRNVFNLLTDSVAGNPYPRMALQINNSAIAAGLGGATQASSSLWLGGALLATGAALTFVALRR